MSRSSTRLVGGIHSVRNLLRHGAEAILEAWIDNGRRDRRLRELIDEFNKLDIAFHPSDREELDRLAPDLNHQGVLVRARAPAALGENALRQLLERIEPPYLLLVLDGVQDPHNLGACLRTADAAGVHAVIAPKDRSVGLTPVVCKVASGAAESIPFVQVTNLARTLEMLAKEYQVWITGTAGESDMSLYDADFQGSTAIVMGAEEKGMRRLTREHCDQLISLPMAGSVESLNVAVATGVTLFEAIRQRNVGK
jgi:23S rRNA (guanosine2251-2'-O)-methyltransferase